jgi:hypothetical protein
VSGDGAVVFAPFGKIQHHAADIVGPGGLGEVCGLLGNLRRWREFDHSGGTGEWVDGGCGRFHR